MTINYVVFHGSRSNALKNLYKIYSIMKDNNSSKAASVGCSDKLQEMRASCFVFPEKFFKKNSSMYYFYDLDKKYM